MKKLLLPLAILLFTAACTKQDMPAPDNTKASPNVHQPASSMRKSGDTLVKITKRPMDKSPITNFKDAGI